MSPIDQQIVILGGGTAGWLTANIIAAEFDPDSIPSRLQQKLDELSAFAAQNDRKAFVEAFVPLDCSADDTSNYLSVLTEDDAEWAALAAEIQAIAAGATVEKIEGDEKTRAVFFFPHPTLERCDREVVFVCVGGEWRAEG